MIFCLFTGDNPFFFNMNFKTMPMVFHGNGPSKIFLNTLGNYIPGQWNKVICLILSMFLLKM